MKDDLGLAIANGLANIACDLAQAQARSHYAIPEATAPPLHHDDAAHVTHLGDEAAQIAHHSSEQGIPDGIPEWAQYPIPYMWEGDRLWLLCRAGDRWWFHDEGWRSSGATLR